MNAALWHYMLLGMAFGASIAVGAAMAAVVLLGLYKGTLTIAAVIHRKRWERARLAEHKALFADFQDEFRKWKLVDGSWIQVSPDDDRGDPTLTTGGFDD